LTNLVKMRALVVRRPARRERRPEIDPGQFPIQEIGIAKSVVHRMKQKIERAAKEGEAGQDGGG